MNQEPRLNKFRWDLVLIGSVCYVILGRLVEFIPNPLIPNAILALNMTVPVIAGYFGGPHIGTLIGLMGTLANFGVEIPYSGIDYFELAAILPHALMGAAAGWVGKSKSRTGAAAMLLVGHGANILAFIAAGLLPIKSILSASLWTGLLAETAIGMIIIVLTISIIEQFGNRESFVPVRQMESREIAIKGGIVLFTILLLGFAYVWQARLAGYLFVIPVILAALLFGALEAWLTAVLLSIPLGSTVLNLGPVAAADQVYIILVLNLMALSVGEMAGILQRQTWLAQKRTTELEQAYAVLNESDRLKSHMIQNISHELRTPLAIIIGYTELLAGDEMGRLLPQQAKAAKTILDYGYQLANLVEQVTVLHQVEEGSLVQESFIFDVLARDRIEAFKQWRCGPLHTLSYSIEQGHYHSTGDAEHLGKVINSLLHNAIKFSPDGGKIHIKVWTKGRSAYLTVQDDGVGIPPICKPGCSVVSTSLTAIPHADSGVWDWDWLW